MIDYTKLYDRLGYRFNNPELLTLAFTHSSKSAKVNYERLEFLGDRILGFTVSVLLYNNFPNEPEGKLARRYMSLVRQETLAVIARQVGLSDYVLLSWGEERSGGNQKDSVLADCCESMLAAIYLDGGIEPVEKVVKTFWTPYLNEEHTAKKDAKSLLQEYAQGMGKALPVYNVLGVSGSNHKPTYIMEVVVEGISPVEGKGSSKRAAMQDAAEKLLKILMNERV